MGLVTPALVRITSMFFDKNQSKTYVDNYEKSIEFLSDLGLSKNNIRECRKAWKDYTITNPPKGFVYLQNHNKYLINKQGVVIGLNRVPIAIYKDSSGYMKVYLSAYSKDAFLHVLLAKEFILNNKELKIVNHKDGDKSNYALSNLEWLSQQNNIKHAIDTGLFNPNGENNGKSKLTDKEALSIYNSDSSTQELSIKYKVSKTTIKDIRAGRKWTSVTKKGVSNAK